MGTWITAPELKARTSSPALSGMESQELEDRYIVPSERLLEDDLNLQIETREVPPDDDARDIPSYLRGTFDTYPAQELLFQDDIKRAILLVAERMATNPNDFSSQSVSGASAGFGPRVPREVYSIMRRWLPSAQRRVVR